jgi:hypothetical protein
MQSTRSRQARPVGAARKDGAVAPATGIAATIANLQRSAGNRAVSALLARDEAKEHPSGVEERTIVMPDPIGTLKLESFSPKGNDIELVIESSPADAELMKAGTDGKLFDEVTIKYGPLTLTLTSVIISRVSISSGGTISVSLNAAKRHEEYKKDEPPEGTPGVLR